MSRHSPSALPSTLRERGITPREAEVLLHLRGRLRNTEIAERLTISVRTVESHVSSLLTKLGADNRVALARIARQVATDLVDTPTLQGVGRGDMPLPTGPLFGRTELVSQLTAALTDVRIITLTGVGGVGKSRVALDVSNRARGWLRDGPRWCELADIRDGASVGHAVAAALDLEVRSHQAVVDHVVSWLDGQQLLLVLDNCEHVSLAVRLLVEAILSACPQIRLLLTSREPVGACGERCWPIEPLSVPTPEEVADPDRHSAVALFVERARAAQPDWELTPAVRPIVADLCRRLGGLPLGIELAAANLRAFHPAEIRDQLSERTAIIGLQQPGTLARHHSLEAAFAWSDDLLSEDERRLFARLSVFMGRFDLNAARDICCDTALTTREVASLLRQLIDRSLIVADTSVAPACYRLLEPVRAYAQERLRHADEEYTLRRRHAQYMRSMVEGAAVGLLGPDELAWVDRLQASFDDIRAAVKWALETSKADLALRLVTGLPDYTHLRTGFNESAAWTEAAMRLPTAATDGRAPAAWATLGRVAWTRDDLGTATLLSQRALQRPKVGSFPRCAHPGDILADVALVMGDAKPALDYFNHAAIQARKDDDPTRLSWAEFYVAMCLAVSRRPNEGIDRATRALTLAREIGNPTGIAVSLYGLGLLRKWSDPDGALALLDESAHVAASVRNSWFEGIALMEMAATRGCHGDPWEALDEFMTVLGHWHRLSDRTQQWVALRYLTRVLVRIGADKDAALIQQALVTSGRRPPLSPSAVGRLMERLPDAEAAGAAALGTTLTLDDLLERVRVDLPKRVGLG